MIDNEKLWRVSPQGKQKDSFILFYTTTDAVRTAFQGDTCKLGLWFDAVLDYELYGKIPSFEDAPPADRSILVAMFEITKSQLTVNHEKWLKRCEINARNAKGDKP